MLALATTPATMPRFRFTEKPAKALRGATLTDVVLNLHAILTNPAAKLDELKDAKHRMLRVLEETRRFPLPQMLVPPFPLPSEREKESIVSGELPDSALVCTTCERPVVRAFVRNQTAITKKSCASSSRSFRVQHSDTRRGMASALTRLAQT